MFNLSNLQDTTRPPRKFRRIGRGTGSKRGKTCGRGVKGDGARQGYRRRFGYEGGQVPLYRKLPVRGFTRGTFAKTKVAISLSLIDRKYQDGEVVNLVTLREKGMIPRDLSGGLKIIRGELNKKVTIEAHAFSKSVIPYLDQKKIVHKIITQ